MRQYGSLRLATAVLLSGAGFATAGTRPEAPAAGPAPFVVRIGVDLVQVDAVVSDGKGNPVTRLRPGDFEVFEDGQRREVTHLTYVTAAAPRPARGLAGAGPDNVVVEAEDTPGPQVLPRSFVFVVDDLGLSFGGMAQTRELLTRFAESEAGSDDQAVIIRTGGPDGQYPLTSDWYQMKATARSLRYSVRGDPGAPVATLDPLAERQGLGDLPSSLVTRPSLDALASILDALREAPGRKSLILISEGFPVGRNHAFGGSSIRAFGDDGGIDDGVQKLGDLANRASVVIHTLDPRGLLPGEGMPSAADFVRFSSMTDLNAQLATRRSIGLSSVNSLHYLSDQTGGLSVTGQNDLLRGLRKIVDDTGGYYLIGYEPDRSTFRGQPGKPRFHTIKVKVRGEGLRVRSRRGFYGVTDEDFASAVK